MFNSSLTKNKIEVEISQILNILQLEKLPPADILEELIDEEVFQLRNYFLRNPVVKPLFLSRIRKLNNFQQIKTQYCEVVNHSKIEENELPTFLSSSMLSLLKSFEKNQAEVKNRITSTLYIPALVSAVNSYVLIQTNFENLFKIKFLEEYKEEDFSEKVKMADQLDTGVVIKLLSAGRLKEAFPILKKEYVRIIHNAKHL